MASVGVIDTSGFMRNRWWIVAASLIGMIVGPGTAVIFTVNVFMVPVTTELGWTRGFFSSGLLASALMSPILTPIFGRLMDRYGMQRISLPVTFIYGISLSCFALLTPTSGWALYVLFGCASGFGACVGPIVYSKAITAWFDRERGFALGIATCGVGLGTFLLPSMAQFFISTFGWRLAYLAVGFTTWFLSFTMILLFVREPPGYVERMRAAHAAAALGTGKQPFGIAARDAILGTRQFWLLFIIFLLEGTACNGILSGNFVPLLMDRGYAPAAAAALLGVSGLAAMAGRIAVGCCLDVLHGPVFSAITMLLPVLGIALLLGHGGAPAPLFAAICIGLAIGAEVDMLGFFVSRYFGRRSFGVLYGLIFAAFTCGVGLGPAILGWGFDHFDKSYDPVLWAYLVATLIAALLFLPLGKYNYPRGTE